MMAMKDDNDADDVLTIAHPFSRRLTRGHNQSAAGRKPTAQINT